MPYDPYQYAVAKASVAGNTTRNVGSAIISTMEKIPEIIKQANIEKKVGNAYTDIINRFAEEAHNIDNNISMAQGAILARKYYTAPINGLDPKTNLQNMLKGEEPAQKYLADLQDKIKLKEVGKISSQIVAAGRNTPSSATQTGQESTVQNEGGMVAAPLPPAISEQNIAESAPYQQIPQMQQGPETPQELEVSPFYREQAYGMYGSYAASGKAPYVNTDILSKDPSMASLQSIKDINKSKLEDLKNKLKHAEHNEDQADKIYGEMNKYKLDLISQVTKTTSLSNAIQRAITSLSANKPLDVKIQEDLRAQGYNGDPTNINELKEFSANNTSTILTLKTQLAKTDQMIKQAEKEHVGKYSRYGGIAAGTIPVQNAQLEEVMPEVEKQRRTEGEILSKNPGVTADMLKANLNMAYNDVVKRYEAKKILSNKQGRSYNYPTDMDMLEESLQKTPYYTRKFYENVIKRARDAGHSDADIFNYIVVGEEK
jgi:hypothetical protein